MLIGILSDSHGQAERTRAAVDLLLQRKAEILLHLGDFETEAVIDTLAGHNVRVVFGNVDHNTQALERYCKRLDITVDHPMGVLEADGKRIAFTHGHLENLMRQAIEENAEYLLHGHSHELRDENIDATRIINPGALHRARRYTAALLDAAADTLEIIEITKEK